MKGTEKQIKWAKDIINKEVKGLQEILSTVTSNEYLNKYGEPGKVFKKEERFTNAVEIVKATLQKLNDIEDAKLVIDNKTNLVGKIATEQEIRNIGRLYSISQEMK